MKFTTGDRVIWRFQWPATVTAATALGYNILPDEWSDYEIFCLEEDLVEEKIEPTAIDI